MKRRKQPSGPTRGQILEQLWKLAAGNATDVAKLAFLEPERAEEIVGQMDLTGLAELKRSGNGAVEVKTADRLRALELLLDLLEEKKEGGDDGASAFYAALEASAGAGREEHGPELFPQTAEGADLVVRPVSGPGEGCDHL